MIIVDQIMVSINIIIGSIEPIQIRDETSTKYWLQIRAFLMCLHVIHIEQAKQLKFSFGKNNQNV